MQPQIFDLQKYILQLTSYICQSNAKYTKNLSTTKNFYEEQLVSHTNYIGECEESILQLKSRVNALQSELSHTCLQLNQVREQLSRAEAVNGEQKGRLEMQEKSREAMYEKLRQLMSESVRWEEEKLQIVRKYEGEVGVLQQSLGVKEGVVGKLEREVEYMREAISDRYSLPEKVQELEGMVQRKEGQNQGLRREIKEMGKRVVGMEEEIQRGRRENVELIKFKSCVEGEWRVKEEQCANKWREIGDNNLRNKEREIREVKEVNEIQGKQIQEISREKNKMQNQGKKMEKHIQELEMKVNKLVEDKHSYMEQFRVLKGQYEGVIRKMEDKLMEYQRVNFNYQEENKDLNEQLYGLQQLLVEVKAMNSLQPVRAQYRQWAQAEILAKQPIKEEKEIKIKQTDKQQKEESSAEWQMLLRNINNIQV